MWWIAAIFLIAAVEAIPAHHSRPETVTGGYLEYSKQCREAFERETCSKIFVDAVTGGTEIGPSFRYYCRKIPAYVPCLESNKQLYMTLLGCDTKTEVIMTLFENVITLDDMWDMTIDLLDTVNDIACSRTDDLIDLIECVKRRDDVFQPKLLMCLMQHFSQFSSAVVGSPEMVQPFNRSTVCGSIYGFTGCMKDAFEEMCGAGVRDILDTVYEDVVVGVVGDSLGCEAETNPFLMFGRSLRDKFRR